MALRWWRDQRGAICPQSVEAYKADPGFDPHGVLLASFDPFLSGYDESRGAILSPSGRARQDGTGIQSAGPWRDACPSPMAGIAFASVVEATGLRAG